MISTPSNTITKLCRSYCENTENGNICKEIDTVVNEFLWELDVRTEIISIQYQMSQNENFADTALIVYMKMF